MAEREDWDLRPRSSIWLAAGPWATVLDALAARFPAVGRERWADRFARGLVRGEDGVPVAADAPHRDGRRVWYWREVADEPSMPVAVRVLHADADLVVADKPAYLPVAPAGGWVRETLVARLMSDLRLATLVPLHRIDRATAGVVLLSANPATRSRYQALFREQRIRKRYEAVAPPLPGTAFPLTYRSRLVSGEPFFRVREAAGEPNSETLIEVMERGVALWRYSLEPLTGRKHQLRVHMAALGAPILNDRYYPVLSGRHDDDYERPLALLARALEFVDPFSGTRRRFESQQGLPPLHES
ncbi:MAG: pseudouridine synthase [Proteobacteria bacterium]|nr:pseudouridine synthase [Pseudomonadota bacterium]